MFDELTQLKYKNLKHEKNEEFIDRVCYFTRFNSIMDFFLYIFIEFIIIGVVLAFIEQVIYNNFKVLMIIYIIVFAICVLLELIRMFVKIDYSKKLNKHLKEVGYDYTFIEYTNVHTKTDYVGGSSRKHKRGYLKELNSDVISEKEYPISDCNVLVLFTDHKGKKEIKYDYREIK